MDALRYLDECDLTGFDLIAASPPCEGYSTMPNVGGGKTDSAAPRLIAPLRERLLKLRERTGLHFIIENVAGARSEMIDPVSLDGRMVGLPLFRERLFECSFAVAPLVIPKKGRCAGAKTHLPKKKGHPPCCKGNMYCVYSCPRGPGGLFTGG